MPLKTNRSMSTRGLEREAARGLAATCHSGQEEAGQESAQPLKGSPLARRRPGQRRAPRHRHGLPPPSPPPKFAAEQAVEAPSVSALIVDTARVARRADWLDGLTRLHARLLKHRSFSWWVAAYVHLILLLTLALWVFDLPEPPQPVLLTASFEMLVEQPEAEAIVQPDPEPVPQTEPEPTPAPTPIEPAVADDVPLAEPLEPGEPTSPTPSELAQAEAAPSEASSELEHGEGSEGDPGPSEKPSPPAHAVTKGNFRAWAEPAMPAPGQPYQIVIEVTLPERVKRYPSSDLSGVVTGADGFRKFIRGWDGELLPIVDRKVLVRIPIVGAERGLRDSIVVQSRILKQRQFIELMYPDMELMLRGGTRRRGGG